MLYDAKKTNAIFDAFKKGKDWLNGVSIDIEGDENSIDPIVLLRAYDSDPTVDMMYDLTCQMVMGKVIHFFREGVELATVAYAGGDLSEKFKRYPYLLDLLMKLCYGLMIKKLTPPSEDSEKEDKR